MAVRKLRSNEVEEITNHTARNFPWKHEIRNDELTRL